MAALPPLGAPAVDTSREAVAEACAVLARDLPRLGVRASDNALAELRDLAVTLDVTARGAPGGLVPGDTCPSNAVDSENGPVLLDFEAAEYRHVAWEAAYLTVPWPSCWCSWRLPDSLAARTFSEVEAGRGSALPAVMAASFQDDLPALRELAAETLAATLQEWGAHPLLLARGVPLSGPRGLSRMPIPLRHGWFRPTGHPARNERAGRTRFPPGRSARPS